MMKILSMRCSSSIKEDAWCLSPGATHWRKSKTVEQWIDVFGATFGTFDQL